MTETMTRAQIEDLPIGTVYQQYGQHYVRWIDGMIDQGGGFVARSTIESHEQQSIEIVHRPDEPLFNENWAQWMDRMAVTTNLAAHVNGVNIGGANRALAKAAIAVHPVFRQGGWGATYHPIDRISAMDGTVLQFGFPDHWSTFGIWRKSGNRWDKVLGGMNEAPRYTVGLVIESPEVLPTVEEPGQRAKEDYLLHVYTSAMESKSEQSWCGVAEQTMARVGIDERSLRPIRLARLAPPTFTAGETVGDKDNLYLAPVGQYVNSHGNLWRKREDGQWQRVGMTRTVGSDGFDAYSTRWADAPAEGGPPVVSEVVASHDQMRQAPVGSQIGEYGTFWTKQEDQQWTRDDDRYGSRFDAGRFSLGTLRWSVVPVGVPGTPVTVAAMDAASVGARVTRSGNIWTKQPSGEWLHEDNGVHYASHRFALENLVWAEPMPVTGTSTMTFGHQAGREGLRVAPPGACVRGEHTYTKSHDGNWYFSDQPTRILHDPTPRLTWVEPLFRSGERASMTAAAPVGCEVQAIDRWRKVADNTWGVVINGGVSGESIRVPDASVASYRGTWV